MDRGLLLDPNNLSMLKIKPTWIVLKLSFGLNKLVSFQNKAKQKSYLTYPIVWRLL